MCPNRIWTDGHNGYRTDHNHGSTSLSRLNCHRKSVLLSDMPEVPLLPRQPGVHREEWQMSQRLLCCEWAWSRAHRICTLMYRYTFVIITFISYTGYIPTRHTDTPRNKLYTDKKKKRNLLSQLQNTLFLKYTPIYWYQQKGDRSCNTIINKGYHNVTVFAIITDIQSDDMGH